jgi:predicted phosphodiesterase
MFKRLVVLSDIQSPFHLPQAVALAIEYIRRYKPDILVLNGDIVDFYILSKFVRVGKARQRSLQEEIDYTDQEIIKPILKAVPEGCQIIWIEGNHEFRLRSYLAVKAPELELRSNDIEEQFRMKARGIKYVGSEDGNGIYRLTSHLWVMHGKWTQVMAAKKYANAVKGSVIFGHTHHEQVWRETKALADGDSQVAIGAGCLCDTPKFNSLDHYDRGFVAGWIDEDSGTFDIDIRRICGKNNTMLFCDYGVLEAFPKKDGTWGVRDILKIPKK